MSLLRSSRSVLALQPAVLVVDMHASPTDANANALGSQSLEALGAASTGGSNLDSADICWMLLSSALVLLMVPALGFFYAGLLKASSALSILTQLLAGFAILSLLFYCVGFTLCFGEPTLGGIIGSPLEYPFLGVLAADPWVSVPEAPTIPGLLYATFQLNFAAITPLLITGAFAERMRFGAFVWFIILWSLLVYYPLCHWVWGGGWLMQMGVVDFAGGIVINSSSGIAALVSAAYIGRREDGVPLPHSIPLTLIGASLLWLGWVGFNGGSALTIGPVAAAAVLSSHIAACTSACVWATASYFSSVQDRKISLVPSANGAIAGLAGISPAAGFIPVHWSPLVGIVVGAASFGCCHLVRDRLGVDDALDVSSVHGVTGLIGSLIVGILASPIVNPAGPTGLVYGGGWRLLGVQALGVSVALVLSATATLLIMVVLDKTIGIRAHVTEGKSFDESLHGENAYNFTKDELEQQTERSINLSRKGSMVSFPTSEE